MELKKINQDRQTELITLQKEKLQIICSILSLQGLIKLKQLK